MKTRSGLSLLSASACVAAVILGATALSAQADDPDQKVEFNYYSVQGLSNPDASVEVYCDFENGWLATGGGGVAPVDPNALWVLTASEPIISDGDAVGWRTQAHRMDAYTNYSTSITARAICQQL